MRRNRGTEPPLPEPEDTMTAQPTADQSTSAGLAMLNAEVTRHASLVGYLDDFWIMMALTLVTIWLVLTGLVNDRVWPPPNRCSLLSRLMPSVSE